MSRTLQRCAEACGRWSVVNRQAVVDRQGRVCGYALRLDDSPADARAAAGGLLSTVFADAGLRRVVGGHRAYLSGPAEILDHAGDLRLPPGQVILEVDEQPVQPPLLATVSRLVRQGYHVAAAAWALAPDADALLSLAGTVRVSFNFGTQDVRRLATRREQLQERGVTLLASDIQNRSEYEECCRLGFDAFHGPFLAEPELRVARGTPTLRVSALAEVLASRGPGGFDALERLILQDAGLAHRFLRLAGSAFSSPRTPLRSVRHALTRLGVETTRRWVMMLLLAGLTDTTEDGPAAHLLGLGLHRARICEVLARQVGASDPDAAFSAGLLSVLPALVHRSMDELLGELALDDGLAGALLDYRGGVGALLAAVVAYEGGAREDADGRPPLLAAIRRIYETSLLWAEETRSQL